MDDKTAEKMQRRYPDISIGDVEAKLRRASSGPKGDRHDYEGPGLSCRESGVVLAEIERLRCELSTANAQVKKLAGRLLDLRERHTELDKALATVAKIVLGNYGEPSAEKTVTMICDALMSERERHSAALDVAEADQRLREHDAKLVAKRCWIHSDKGNSIQGDLAAARAKFDRVKGVKNG